MSQVNYYCGAILLLLTAGTIRAGTNVPRVELARLNLVCPSVSYTCTASYSGSLTWTFQNLPQNQFTVTFLTDSTPPDPPLLHGIFSIVLDEVVDLGSSCANFTSTLTYGIENVQTSVSVSCSNQIDTEETGILDPESVCPGVGGIQNGGDGMQNGNGGNQMDDDGGLGVKNAGSIGCLFLTSVLTFIILY